MILICCVGGLIICVNACVAWWLWLVIFECQGHMFLTFCLTACPLSNTGEGILCMPCTLCLLVLGESAYKVVVPFCSVGYPL